MKEVVKEEPKQTITLDNINNNSIVGVLFYDDNRCFVRHSEFGFVSCSLNDSDVCGNWYRNTVNEYVEEVLKDKAKAFVFNTYEELFNWLKS